MKIMFLIKALSNPGGGAERVLIQVASLMGKQGHEVQIVSFDPCGEKSFYRIPDELKQVKLGIGDIGKRSSTKEMYLRIIKTRRLLMKEKPDIIIPFMHSMFVPCAIAKLGLKIKAIGSEHTTIEHYKDKRGQMALFAIASLFLDGLTVMSEKIKKGYPKIIQRKMTVLPNPVSITKCQRERESEQLTILSAGRFDENKNHMTLIKAFELIESNFPQWQLKIVGEGPDREKAQMYVASKKLVGRVIIPGVSVEIEREYADAKIFALASKYESFGMVTAEAMMYGLPVIGFARCPGTNDLIADGINGLLVDSNFEDPVPFSKGLRTLMEDPELRERLGRNGRSIAEKYSPENIAHKWETLIKDVTKCG